MFIGPITVSNSSGFADDSKPAHNLDLDRPKSKLLLPERQNEMAIFADQDDLKISSHNY